VDDTALTALRAELEQERELLLRRMADLGWDAGEGSPAFDEGFADSGQVAAEKGENRVLANQLHDTLQDVERALRKLDDGGFGACEDCGTPIADARLEAMPATRWCIDCASRR
jgi:DnaK suppressor protein